MIELTTFFNLLEQMTTAPIQSFHLAEGPGGFIEALTHLRKCKTDRYIGMTILDDKHDTNIPAWKKSQRFLAENSNVEIENGADGTGDILKLENLLQCQSKYSSSMDIITGDGGFDFSIDFNNQEKNIAKLLFGQIVYALIMQKYDGHFILKIFDCFTYNTLDILSILSSFYKKVYITKPQTSRYANSEKYVVCKGFLFHHSKDFAPFLITAFSNMTSSNLHPQRFLTIPYSLYFLTKMEEYNAIFGQQQIENIYYTLSFIEYKYKQEKLDTLVRSNIQKCIHWCIKYSVSYNNVV
jgi:23S rRNA U2552 (ribose-2'-O)-methylase RlmE/FtsJ